MKSVDLKVLETIMKQIKEHDYPKSKQVERFIEDVLEHFGEERVGS